MDPFDWHHLLTPLSVLISSSNFLTGIALKPDHHSLKLNKLSVLGYSGCLLGWLIMSFGISLKSMDWLVKVAIIGWLVWAPSLCLMAFCLLRRLIQDKDHFSPVAVKSVGAICTSFKIMLSVLKIIALLLLKFLMRKPKYTVSAEDELSHHNSYGGPYIFSNPPKNAIGEGNRYPPHDPHSPWSG